MGYRNGGLRGPSTTPTPLPTYGAALYHGVVGRMQQPSAILPGGQRLFSDGQKVWAGGIPGVGNGGNTVLETLPASQMPGSATGGMGGIRSPIRGYSAYGSGMGSVIHGYSAYGSGMGALPAGMQPHVQAMAAEALMRRTGRSSGGRGIAGLGDASSVCSQAGGTFDPNAADPTPMCSALSDEVLAFLTMDQQVNQDLEIGTGLMGSATTAQGGVAQGALMTKISENNVTGYQQAIFDFNNLETPAFDAMDPDDQLTYGSLYDATSAAVNARTSTLTASGASEATQANVDALHTLNVAQAQGNPTQIAAAKAQYDTTYNAMPVADQATSNQQYAYVNDASAGTSAAVLAPGSYTPVSAASQTAALNGNAANTIASFNAQHSGAAMCDPAFANSATLAACKAADAASQAAADAAACYAAPFSCWWNKASTGTKILTIAVPSAIGLFYFGGFVKALGSIAAKRAAKPSPTPSPAALAAA